MNRVAVGMLLVALAAALVSSTGTGPRSPRATAAQSVPTAFGDAAGDPSAPRRQTDLIPTPSPEPQPEPTSPPAPPAQPEVVEPLTGRPAADEAALARAVVAVKVDNTATARPPAGLQHADVVMVQPVESATRFAALFHSTDPGRLGPVRSGRFVDADLLVPYEPLLAMSGAAEPVRQALRDAGLVLYEVGSAGAWQIDRSRPSPHQVFAHLEPLWDAADADGLAPAAPPWAFAAEPTAEGAGTERAVWRYPYATAVVWRWDAAQRRWQRSQDGQAHRTVDGTRIAADNVVIARVPRGPDYTRPVEVIGEGELIVLRQGRRVAGTWQKTAIDAHFVWRDAAGEVLALDPGTTWIELVPDDVAIDVVDARRQPVPGVR